jgi:hypothetical protein
MLKWLTAKKSPSAVPAAEAGTALAALFEPTGAPALAELPPPPPPKPEGRGRLIFALDATASRAPTWVEACRLQAAMFEATAGLGELRSQLVYYRAAEQRASDWVGSAEALLQLMRPVYCLAGNTQIGWVLQHAATETRRQKVGAVIFIGDAMEENSRKLVTLAEGLGRLETPIFLFQEGHNPAVARVYQALAKASGGAHLPFDLAGIEQLKELLGAVAIYAIGGKEALAEAAVSDAGAALLLTHLK